MVTQYENARRVYENEPCARPFEEDLHWHLRLGWVISTPNLFMMARQVMHDWPKERLQEPWYVHPTGDAVFIWLLAGDMRQALSAAPWPRVEWIGWERSNIPRMYRLESVLAKMKQVPPCNR